ncbi:hypothetical protein ACS8FD_14285, partial [Psychrobacter sp. 1U2]|uniref:hypothetical protein n=1 Tax=Psychrobacter sp. 1U2 TaxID=3453577 RepID=UPI003F4619E6
KKIKRKKAPPRKVMAEAAKVQIKRARFRQNTKITKKAKVIFSLFYVYPYSLFLWAIVIQ